MTTTLYPNGLQASGLGPGDWITENCGLKAAAVIRGVPYSQVVRELWDLRGGYTEELPVLPELETLIGARFIEYSEDERPTLKDWLLSAPHCAFVGILRETGYAHAHAIVKVGDRMIENGPVTDFKGYGDYEVWLYLPIYEGSWSNEVPAVRAGRMRREGGGPRFHVRSWQGRRDADGGRRTGILLP